MKKQLFAVLSMLFFTCAAMAQPAPVSAELNPLKQAAQQASKTLPQGYTFSDLYKAVKDILETNAQSTLNSAADALAKQNPFLQGTEEFAMMRLSESMLARSNYKRMQSRNRELLKAFKAAGELLEKDGIVFNADNKHHLYLVQVQLNKMRQAVKDAKDQRTKKFFKLWMKSLENAGKYGIKY